MENNKGKIFRKGKKQSGITLVALVVTVVVLLILAGVSIYLVLDNNGIITKAGEAKDRTAIEAIREARELWSAEVELGSNESLSDYLFRQGLITEEEKTIVDEGGKISRGDYKFSFKETLVDMFKAGDLQVGDVIDYPNPTEVLAEVKATDSNYSDTGYTSPASRTGMSIDDGYTKDMDQTFTINQNTNWVVLGLSKDETQLMLTTEEPLKKVNTSTGKSSGQYFYLRGAKGCAYDYGIAELNKICAIYKNDLASEARSMTIDDINRLCNVTVDIENKQVTNSESENIDKWNNIGTELALVNPYQDQEGYLYQSPEDYIDGNALEEQRTPRITGDSYRYYCVDAIDRNFEVLFGYGCCWLASRTIYVDSDYCGWGPSYVFGGQVLSYQGLFYSNGEEKWTEMMVRPVVFLRSDITMDDLYE